MKTLHLTLHKKWFDMIASGEKTEEYREIKPYWAVRLFRFEQHELEQPDLIEELCFDLRNWGDLNNELTPYKFDATKFTNGYGAHRPTVTTEFKGVSVGFGRPEWGAPTDRRVFIIGLGEVKTQHQ